MKKEIPVLRTFLSTVSLPFFLINITAAAASAQETSTASPPLSVLDASDTVLAETGLILFDQARQRYWASNGSPQGTMGLLSRASRVYAYISDPAARYYLTARLELYRGWITLEFSRRSRARPYFARAMEFAAESANFSETAEAYRVRAEAGYGWILTRRFRGKAKMGRDTREWLARSLELDPGSISAALLKARFTHRTSDDDEEPRLETLRLLESLESREELHSVLRFRSRVLLSLINADLNRSTAAEVWCEKAAEIFRHSTALKHCR